MQDGENGRGRPGGAGGGGVGTGLRERRAAAAGSAWCVHARSPQDILGIPRALHARHACMMAGCTCTRSVSAMPRAPQSVEELRPRPIDAIGWSDQRTCAAGTTTKNDAGARSCSGGGSRSMLKVIYGMQPDPIAAECGAANIRAARRRCQRLLAAGLSPCGGRDAAGGAPSCPRSPHGAPGARRRCTSRRRSRRPTAWRNSRPRPRYLHEAARGQPPIQVAAAGGARGVVQPGDAARSAGLRCGLDCIIACTCARSAFCVRCVCIGSHAVYIYPLSASARRSSKKKKRCVCARCVLRVRACWDVRAIDRLAQRGRSRC